MMTWPGTLAISHPCPSGAGQVGVGLHQAPSKGAGRVGARRLLTRSVMTTWCPSGRALCRALTGAYQRLTPLPCLGSQAQQVSQLEMSPVDACWGSASLGRCRGANVIVFRSSAAPLLIHSASIMLAEAVACQTDP